MSNDAKLNIEDEDVKIPPSYQNIDSKLPQFYTDCLMHDEIKGFRGCVVCNGTGVIKANKWVEATIKTATNEAKVEAVHDFLTWAEMADSVADLYFEELKNKETQ